MNVNSLLEHQGYILSSEYKTAMELREQSSRLVVLALLLLVAGLATMLAWNFIIVGEMSVIPNVSRLQKYFDTYGIFIRVLPYIASALFVLVYVILFVTQLKFKRVSKLLLSGIFLLLFSFLPLLVFPNLESIEFKRNFLSNFIAVATRFGILISVTTFITVYFGNFLVSLYFSGIWGKIVATAGLIYTIFLTLIDLISVYDNTITSELAHFLKPIPESSVFYFLTIIALSVFIAAAFFSLHFQIKRPTFKITGKNEGGQDDQEGVEQDGTVIVFEK